MLIELKSFLLYAQTGSVQRVAERLPLTQPAVSRHLQRLERILGTTLIDRRAKPTKLTPAGSALLPRVSAILAAVEELKQAAKDEGEPDGCLRVGVAHALAESTLADSLSTLGSLFPKLSFQLISGWTHELRTKLHHGELDAIIVFDAGNAGQAGTPPGRIMTVETIEIFVSQTLSLPEKPGIAQLNEFGWVLTPDSHCGSRVALRAAVEHTGSRLRIAAEVHGVDLQISLVERGLGVGLAPRRRLEALRHRSLRIVSVPDVKLTMHATMERAAYLGKLDKVLDALEHILIDRLTA